MSSEAKKDASVSPQLSSTAKKNIEAIAQLEQGLHGRRSRMERLAMVIARFFGSPWFIAAHAVVIGIWIAINCGTQTEIPSFDPYPFPFLSLVVGIEFIFLTTFVIMNQNLQSKRQEHWGHLTLQVCLLAEQEVTKNMQMLQLICQHLKLRHGSWDDEVHDLSQSTPVETLVEEIERSRDLPTTSDAEVT